MSKKINMETESLLNILTQTRASDVSLILNELQKGTS